MAIATLSIDIEARLAGLEAGLDKASRIAQQNADRISKSFDGIKSIGAGLASSLGAAFSVTALSAYLRTVIEGIDALNDLRDATGASIENLSALEDVAARTGTSFDAVGASLTKLNGVLKDAKPGGDSEKVLKAIGLSAEELRKIDPAEALQKVAVALDGYADTGNKARIIQELFGKSVREVAPFLKDLAEAGRLNGTLTTKQAEEAEKFNKQLLALQKNTVDLARDLSGPLVSAINETIQKFKDGAKEGKGFFGTLRDEQLKLLGFAPDDELTERAKKIAGLTEVLKNQLLPLQLRNKYEADLAVLLREQEAARSRMLNSTAGAGRGGVNPDLVKPEAPDISGISVKLAKLKNNLPGPTESKALADAIQALNSTDVAKLEALNAKLTELFGLQRETRGDPAVAEAIRATREEIDKLNAASFGPAILDPKEATKQAFLRSEKEGYDQVIEKIKEVNDFAQQAGRNIQDALGDTVARTLKGDFDNIGELWKNLLIDMAAQAFSAQLGKALFGDFATTGKIGGGIGELLAFIPGFAVGTDYVPRDMVAKVHKGERILTADQNRQGWGAQGPAFVFNQTNNFASGVTRGEVVAGVASAQENTLAQVRLLLARKGLA